MRSPALTIFPRLFLPCQADVKPKIQYKVIVIGQGSTGKTSIINRYVRGQFSKNYKVTVRAPTEIEICGLISTLLTLVPH